VTGYGCGAAADKGCHELMQDIVHSWCFSVFLTVAGCGCGAAAGKGCSLCKILSTLGGLAVV